VRKFDVVDVVLGFFIVLGAVMTALNFFATRGPSSEIVDSSIQEITPAPPPVQRHFGQPIALFTTAPPHHQQDVYVPWRMGDWAQCLDGQQFYETNEQYPTEPPAELPCARHGGVRAYGPGRRLNER
jgi:hypothetical protein